MNIQVLDVTYVCRTDADVRRACADGAEYLAQRTAIARGLLKWTPDDEPLPPAGFSGAPARRVAIG